MVPAPLFCLQVEEFCYITDNTYTREQVRRWEGGMAFQP